MRLCQPHVQCASLVLLQFFDESVFHLPSRHRLIRPTREEEQETYLCEEGCVELIPLGGFQVGLFEHSGLAEDVNRCAYIQVPARKLGGVAFVGAVELLDVVLGVLDDDLVGLTV